MCQEGIPEEDGDESDYEPNDATVASDHEKESGQKVQLSVTKSRIHTPTIFSPFDSPKTSPKILSPKPDMQGKNEATSVLRLLSTRMTDSAIATSLPASPGMSNEYSISSADSDCELIV